MATHEQMIARSKLFYSGLLSAYPGRFRNHFGAEMTQIFIDCCRLQLRRNGARGIALVWFRALLDLAGTIPQEWRREIASPDNEIDYTGLADFFMVGVVVGSNLLGWGWMGAVVALHLTAPNIMQYWNAATILLTAAVTLGLAVGLGLLAAVIAERSSRTENTRIPV